MSSTHQWTLAEQRQRALEIAVRDGLQVVGQGWTRDGRQCFAVPSRSERNRWHLVVVVGTRLVCDCYAGRRGRVCAHRATVHERLLAERKAQTAGEVHHAA